MIKSALFLVCADTADQIYLSIYLLFARSSIARPITMFRSAKHQSKCRVTLWHTYRFWPSTNQNVELLSGTLTAFCAVENCKILNDKGPFRTSNHCRCVWPLGHVGIFLISLYQKWSMYNFSGLIPSHIIFTTYSLLLMYTLLHLKTLLHLYLYA